MSLSDKWTRLLSPDRFGSPSEHASPHSARSEFDRDYDRIAFSSAFRRLQDKTQVFPLSKNDFTRTRLTHSIEVSCVGRTLGRLIGAAISKSKSAQVDAADVGSIVAAACLAHDIGNPPFGHSGEAAIQSWAEGHSKADGTTASQFATWEITNPHEIADLCLFEGNAQGFRVLTKLQAERRKGGLRLTQATLGAMMKYPCPSRFTEHEKDSSKVEQKKFGFFKDDESHAADCLRALGLNQYASFAFQRHPLAFLVEAADDICYAIVDLEDSGFAKK